MRQRRRRDAEARVSVDERPNLSQGHLPEPNSSASCKIYGGPLSSVIPLEDVDITHVDLVGGKGANLGQCLKAGFPIPTGFCISRTAFSNHITRMTQDSSRHSDLASLREDILGMDLLGADGKDILDSYRKMGSPIVAVRSSATMEDSKKASFAGQLETFLGVIGEEDVLLSVKRCWASLFTERVVKYASVAGKISLDRILSDVSCCVIVQEMVDADSAGVAFTVNPLTNNGDQYVITSNYGLGESVVSDMVTPDTFTVDARDGSIISSEISQKKTMVKLTKLKSSNGTYSEKQGVPPAKQNLSSLPTEAVSKLAGLCTALTKFYKIPLDIEWAWKNGKIYVLQSRPVTTFNTTKTKGRSVVELRPIDDFYVHGIRTTDWVTTCNAQEMFPGPGTPLTISTFGKGIEYGMKRLHFDFGILNQYHSLDDAPRAPWVYGHFFINMTNVLAVATHLPFGIHAKNNAEMSLLGQKNEKETLEDLRNAHGEPHLLKKIFNSLCYAKTMLLSPLRISVMEERAKRVEAYFAPPNDGDTEKPESLYALIDKCMPEYLEQWADGILTSSPSAGWMLLIMKIIARDESEMWSTDRLAELSTILTCKDCHKVESANAVLGLNELADALKGHPRIEEFTNASSLNDALHFLRGCKDRRANSSEASPSEMFEDFLDRHGHRCVKEAELRNPDWFEDSSPLIRLLQEKLKPPPQAAHRFAIKPPDQQEESSTSVLRKLLVTKWSHVSCFQRPLLRLAIAQTRAGVARRELGKSLQVRVHSSFKRAYRRLGVLLERAGILPEIDLMYFFTHEELRHVCSGCSGSTFKLKQMNATATNRRNVFVKQSHLSFCDLHRGVPKPLDPSTRADLNDAAETILLGTPVSSGNAVGKARIIRTLADACYLQYGEILICPFTDVGWTPYFSLAIGLVTEIGGLLSHGAVVAREYGLPCIVNVKGATTVIKDGDFLRLDCDKGTVHVCKT